MSTIISIESTHPPKTYFHPSHWGNYFLESAPLNTVKQGEMEKEVKQLKEEVRKKLLEASSQSLEQLNLIEALERLGVGYQFEKEIEEALVPIYENYHALCEQDHLYHFATRFRILRQHGYRVPSCVFEKFKDSQGDFKGDMIGMLSLYEASHVRTNGDDILDEACAFTTGVLKSAVAEKSLRAPLAQQVAHSLHQPLHKGNVRIESRVFISFYEQNPSHDKTLLRLAKLDFNLLQMYHQKELQQISRWWKEFFAKVPFARDRLVEGYLWVVGTYYELKYEAARKIFIKIFMIVQVLDDIFDAFGTFDILELLAEAINRMEPSYITRLPQYFDDCYKELLDIVDASEKFLAEVGKEYGIIQFKKQLDRCCQSWIVEAKWCKEKHIPPFEEYFKNALISIGQVVGIVGMFIGMASEATTEGFAYVGEDPMPKPIRGSVVIFRLMNDLASTKIEQASREHVCSSIQSYKRKYPRLEEEEIYEALEKDIENAWKDMNEGLLRPFVIPKPLMDRIINVTRSTDVFYKYRHDAYTVVNQVMKDKCASVLVDPIPL